MSVARDPAKAAGDLADGAGGQPAGSLLADAPVPAGAPLLDVNSGSTESCRRACRALGIGAGVLVGAALLAGHGPGAALTGGPAAGWIVAASLRWLICDGLGPQQAGRPYAAVPLAPLAGLGQWLTGRDLAAARRQRTRRTGRPVQVETTTRKTPAVRMAASAPAQATGPQVWAPPVPDTPALPPVRTPVFQADAAPAVPVVQTAQPGAAPEVPVPASPAPQALASADPRRGKGTRPKAAGRQALVAAHLARAGPAQTIVDGTTGTAGTGEMDTGGVDTPPGQAGRADNLTVIQGIGQKVSVELAGLGITSLAQIANWTEQDVLDMQRRLKPRAGRKDRITRDRWVAQARALVGAQGADVAGATPGGGAADGK